MHSTSKYMQLWCQHYSKSSMPSVWPFCKSTHALGNIFTYSYASSFKHCSWPRWEEYLTELFLIDNTLTKGVWYDGMEMMSSLENNEWFVPRSFLFCRSTKASKSFKVFSLVRSFFLFPSYHPSLLHFFSQSPLSIAHLFSLFCFSHPLSPPPLPVPYCLSPSL